MQSSQAVSYAQAKSYCAARKAILPAIRTADDLTHFKGIVTDVTCKSIKSFFPRDYISLS